MLVWLKFPMLWLLPTRIATGFCCSLLTSASMGKNCPPGNVKSKITTKTSIRLSGDTDAASSSVNNSSDSNDRSTSTSSATIFLEIEVADEKIGRLQFIIPDTKMLPLHTENILQLCSKEKSSIDPRMKYTGCEFQHAPQFVEGFAQYRWGHTLHGRGRNTVGRADERIKDPTSMTACTHSVYGGQYYGLHYENDIPKQDLDGKDATVVLTVPLVGPGRGSTDLCIVRVGESPPEWKERLLLNSAVLGWMDPSSMETLQTMARQTRGPPKVVDSGVL